MNGAREQALRRAAAVMPLAAAGIHAYVTPEHLQEWFAAGVFFLGLAVAQAGLGIALLRARSSRMYGVTILLSVGTVMLWAESRVSGLPFGPEAGNPELVGVLDVASSVLELLIATALWPLAFPPQTISPHSSVTDRWEH